MRGADRLQWAEVAPWGADRCILRKTMNVCIYPTGAWGTAMGLHLHRIGHTVTLVPFTTEEALDMASARENRAFLPGFSLPADIQVGVELMPSLMEAELLILAAPSQYLRSVCKGVRASLEKAWRLDAVLTLSKGLEETTYKLPADIVGEELPQYAHGVLSGPTFASQVAEGQPSALVLGMEDAARAEALQESLSGAGLRIYRTEDVNGVELGGCLKNVYAIAAGMCDGLGLRDNSKAALLTRALHEMVRLGRGCGGRSETFYGLSGFGDLFLTCNGRESRNRTFGEAVAKGESADELLADGRTVEGYHTTRIFHSLCRERGIDAPILAEIHAVLFENKPVRDAMDALMRREQKVEYA